MVSPGEQQPADLPPRGQTAPESTPAIVPSTNSLIWTRGLISPAAAAREAELLIQRVANMQALLEHTGGIIATTSDRADDTAASQRIRAHQLRVIEDRKPAPKHDPEASPRQSPVSAFVAWLSRTLHSLLHPMPRRG